MTMVLAYQTAFADDCLDKRRKLISNFGLNLSGYSKHVGEYAYANVHEADDVLDSADFKSLCTNDQKKFKRILYSTFRMILVDEKDEPIETEENEIVGTLVGDRTWLVPFPNEIYTSFINYWTKKKNLRIKLINMDEDEGVATYVTNNNMINYGDHKTPSILKSLYTIVQINPEFVHDVGLKIFPSEIVPDYDAFLTNKNDMTSFNSKIFVVGYDDDDLMIAFGLNSAFKDADGKILTSTSKIVSSKIAGGGVYDENFNMVGMHYYNGVYSDTNKKDEYKKIFNVVDSISSQMLQKIINWIRVDETFREFKARQKKK